MDTRWRKSKIIVSVVSLFLGAALLLANLPVTLSMLADGKFRENLQSGGDYQDTEAFAGVLSARLETLLGAAVGGEGWYKYQYGWAYEAGDSYTAYSEGGYGLLSSWEGVKSLLGFSGYAETDTATEYEVAESGEDRSEYSLDDYMNSLAGDRNLLYAVTSQGNLLYTNMDGLAGQEGTSVGMEEIETLLPGDAYNFLLYFNRNGDGKVEAVKDGAAVDIYGDGIYTPDSRWYVPGYTNFQANEPELETAVFLAAARVPQLYVVRSGEYGTEQQGGGLYYMQREIREQIQLFWAGAFRVCVGAMLLTAAFFLRSNLREMMRVIGKGLGRMRSALRRKSLSYPVQKRMVRIQWLVGLPLMLLLGFLLAVMLYLYNWMSWNDLLPLFYSVLAGMALVLTGCAVYARKNRRLAEDVGRIADQVAAVRAGDLAEKENLPEDSDLQAVWENLNEIREGMEHALEERTKSERMKVELIANVSHDLKTPLTSIVSYIELLKQEEGLPDAVRDYIRILEEKSSRLGEMVQDVFEVSKAASGQLPVNLETLDFGKLLRQTLADMNGAIEKSGLSLRASIPAEPVEIAADGQRLYRVFQNILQNALQYSLEGSRIYLSLAVKAGNAQAALKNTSAAELNMDVDFTERFVRGDESRTDGGSGLGLSIARSFTEACGGTFQVETDADLFTVIVTFPVEKDVAQQ